MAANYGLMTDMASGIKEGLIAYQTTKKMKQDQQMLGLLHGIQTDENGNMSYTPQKQMELDAQRKKLAYESSQYDPDSDASKASAGFLSKLSGGKVAPEDFSQMPAAEQKQFLPAFQQSQKSDVAEEMRADRVSRQNETAMERKSQKQREAEEKDKKATEGMFLKLKDDLDANKARGGNLASNQKRIDNADRLLALSKEANGNIRNLDPREMEELAIGMQAMLSAGGQGSASQVEALVPKTWTGKRANIVEWLTSNPTGADQQKFVEKMTHTIEREREVAADQVRKAQSSRLSAYGNLYKKDPDSYKRIVGAYGFAPENLDEFGQYKAPEKRGLLEGVHPQDTEAVAWAKANPKDPRASAILKANGM